jgi:hypothetical protein
VNYDVRAILGFSNPDLFRKAKQEFLNFLEVSEKYNEKYELADELEYFRNKEKAIKHGHSEETIKRLNKERDRKTRYYARMRSNFDEFRSCLVDFYSIFNEDQEKKETISKIAFQIEQAKKANPNDENIMVLQKILDADLEKMIKDKQKQYDAVRKRFIKTVKKYGIDESSSTYQNVNRIIGYYQHKVLMVTDSNLVKNKDTNNDHYKQDEIEKLAVIEKYFRLISRNKVTEVKRVTFITKLGFKPNKMKTSGKIYIEKLAQVNVQLHQLEEALHLIQKLNEHEFKSMRKFELLYEELKNVIAELQSERYLLNREIEKSDYSKIEEKVKLSDEKEAIVKSYYWLAYRYYAQKNQKDPDQDIIAQLSKEMDSIKLTEKEKEETSLNARQAYQDDFKKEKEILIREREIDEKTRRYKELAYLAQRFFYGKERTTPEHNYATVSKEMDLIDLPSSVKAESIQEAKNKINKEYGLDTGRTR